MASKTEDPQGLPPLMTAEEVAAYLGLSKDRVYRLLKYGNPPIPQVRVGPRVLVPSSGLRGWLDRGYGAS